MRTEYVTLATIQERDLRLQDIRTQLERIPEDKSLAATRLADNQASVEAAKSAGQHNEVAIKTLELDIETRRETINRLKTQQFETRKNEEFNALKHEIMRYTEDVDGLETQELELMEKADALNSVLKDATAALAKIQGAVNEEVKMLDERVTTFEAEAITLESEREAKIAETDEDLFSMYSRLLKTRGVPVLVALSDDGQCRGCHVKAISSIQARVRGEKEMVQCENCGRILYPE
ncbi:MAG: C4-type zinc ribbon domain-containing protein [Akkermansiaceae bacterium]|nr:C4-type zinc ribbon domain-containing protein [Akkermansiaceae bacterium]|tara:strand:+ start:266 stop:970 length:705 start_codon:yes stop_codon:yes gene_type:complete